MASSVNLGDALEAFITEAVKTGRYGSRSEVLREGVRMVQDRELLWAKAEAEIGKGIEDSIAGRVTPAEEVFDQLIAKYRTMAAEQKRRAA
jgi:antitoxin ParD1/3/4